MFPLVLESKKIFTTGTKNNYQFYPFFRGCFGLWLDGDLYHGSSHQCKTFGNRTLSSDEDFVVKSIECWGFI